MSFEKIEKICSDYGARLCRNVEASGFTSFKIGGKCELVAYPNSKECVKALLIACREEKIPLRTLGKCSNVLVSDNGLSGVTMLLGSDFSKTELIGEEIYAEAGASLIQICRLAAENGLSGLEFAYGIPGSVGGALYMNAGAFGGEMKDVVISAEYIDKKGELSEINAEQMQLSYRHSFFTNSDDVIVGVRLRLKKGDKSEIESKMNGLMAKRREKQPLEYPSGGSTFKRPEGDFAGRLIDISGLRGFSVGGAEVSEKHCGFVINRNGASFSDVCELIEIVKKTVLRQTGVLLECEVEILGE